MAQTDLGKWMITNGGDYNPETTYEQLTIVLYNNSMFLTLKTVKGITPVNDNINYSLMAQGAAATLLSAINATDTYGALGEVGATVSSQALVDYLADSVMNKLIAKTQIANDLTTQDSDKVLSALQGYNLKQSVDELNGNLNDKQDKIYQPLYRRDIINDWNNVSAQGWYSGYNLQNAPTSGWVCAINIPYNGDESYSCLIATNGVSLYTRYRDGYANTWRAWREYAAK